MSTGTATAAAEADKAMHASPGLATDRGQSKSIGVRLVGLSYGALAAAIYLGLRQTGAFGGLPIFSAACGLLFCAHLPIAPARALRSLIAIPSGSRGVLFGITQVLLIRAQATSPTSTVFISALAGSITSTSMGHFFLSERMRWYDAIALCLCAFGLIVADPTLRWNGWALAGGLTQGLTAIVARKIILSGSQPFEVTTSGYFYAAVIGTLAQISITGSLGFPTWTPSFHTVLYAAGAIGVLQYAFFYLYRHFNTQQAAVLSLSRIPWAIAMELLIIKVVPAPQKLVGAALMMFGAAISIRFSMGQQTIAAVPSPNARSIQ